MRILFVNKGDTMQELLGIMYLSACLKRDGHTVEMVFISRGDPIDYARRFKPDMLAYSTTTGLHYDYLTINRELKKLGPAFSVFGGPHPTFFPEMIHEHGVDAICIGEGEEAISELANRLEAGQDYLDVRNFWFKHNDEIVQNEVRPYIDDLDTLPFPDRELFYKQDPFLRRNPVKTMIARRGCPNKCSYCFNHYYHKIYHKKGKILRLRSVDNVLAELEQLVAEYPLELLGFVDDHFLLSVPWLEEFAEKYSSRFDLPFYCGVHVHQINEYACHLLKKAGCQAVYMGIEAGDDRIRRELLYRHISRDEIKDAAITVRQFGLKLFAQNMLGFPSGSFQTDMRTVFLNIDIKPVFSWVSLCQPFPRTDLGEYSVKHGYFDGTIARMLPSYHAQSALTFSSDAEKKQIERMHHFFDAMVRYPKLVPFFLLLTRLPLDSLYIVFYKVWFGFHVRFYVFRYRLSVSDFLATVWRFFNTTHLPKLSQLRKK